MKKTLGGDRLGSGAGMRVAMHNFERSTFNQNRSWLSSMGPGFLVPCFNEVGTNGDKFEIEIDTAIRTLPTLKPLFGTFKFQCDIFAIPIRLYNGLLHNNMNNIAMQMNKVLFPTIGINSISAKQVDEIIKNGIQYGEIGGHPVVRKFYKEGDIFNHPTSLMRYLGYYGTLRKENTKASELQEVKFNALKILAYYDIFKNYYANKQEKKCFICGTSKNEGASTIEKTVNVPLLANGGKIIWIEESSNNGDSIKHQMTGNYTEIVNRDGQNIKVYIPIYYEPTKANGFFDMINTETSYKLNKQTIINKVYDWTINVNGTPTQFRELFAKGTISIVDNIGNTDIYTTPLSNNLTNNTTNSILKNIKNPKTPNLNDFNNKNPHDLQIIKNDTFSSMLKDNKVINAENDPLFWVCAIGPCPVNVNNLAIGNTSLTGVEGFTLTSGEINNPSFSIFDFDLDFVDEMRKDILKNTELGVIPWNRDIKKDITTKRQVWDLLTEYDSHGIAYNTYPCQGLALKTYQSDMFNNWISDENVKLVNDISALTINVVDGKGLLKMDELIFSKKVYNMLNRIAMSGGTWQDWQEVIYSENSVTRAEQPIYCGGISTEIAFEEVVQTAPTEQTHVGELAGKGITFNKKGGKVVINCNEPTIIMGIASITPRITYYQGANWFNSLMNIDQLHKPSLDGIGFQDNTLDRAAFWMKTTDAQGAQTTLALGKQPAWLNYMTAIDEVFGIFASTEDDMSLNRNYTFTQKDNVGNILDATTYIEPKKFNYPFADASQIAQNFWVQLQFNVKSRRKMSAKQIPNL